MWWLGLPHPIYSRICVYWCYFNQLAKILTGYKITGGWSSGIFMGISISCCKILMYRSLWLWNNYIIRERKYIFSVWDNYSALYMNLFLFHVEKKKVWSCHWGYLGGVWFRGNSNFSSQYSFLITLNSNPILISLSLFFSHLTKVCVWFLYPGVVLTQKTQTWEKVVKPTGPTRWKEVRTALSSFSLPLPLPLTLLFLFNFHFFLSASQSLFSH